MTLSAFFPVIAEVLVLGVLVAWDCAVDFAGSPKPIPFLEQDPSLSFPRRVQSVPTSTMAAISIFVPGALFLVASAIVYVYDKTKRRTIAKSMLWLCVLLAQALLLTDAINNSIKVWLSYPRPNFFALCDYKGFSSNYTAYLEATSFGAVGDPNLCVGSMAWDAQRSFPSGHAAISSAGMTVATLFLRSALQVRQDEYFGLAPFAAATPLAIAVWISLSRVRDRWHTVVDIVCGMLLGAACAFIAWKNYRARGQKVDLLWADKKPVDVASEPAMNPLTGAIHTEP